MKGNNNKENADAVTQDLHEVVAEVNKQIRGSKRDLDADASLKEDFFYQIENRFASNPDTPFVFLATFASIIIIVGGLLWKCLASDIDGDVDVFGFDDYQDSIFLSLQLVASAGFDDSIPDVNGLRILYFLLIFLGLIVFAILVGFITDGVSSYMKSLAEGRTKVIEDSHTLILGWNEATVRVVVQISFLRRQYQMLNEKKFWLIQYIPILRVILDKLGMLERPSTPLAANDIVIMTMLKTKAEMHRMLSKTMAERGINPARTKLGQNVICRVGDPTNCNDLVRVGAHRAAAIITMMTDRDIKESDLSGGKIENGATLRTALAIRHVLFANPYNIERNIVLNPDLRIVLQMTAPSVFVDAACFKGPLGNDVIIPCDITVFLNSLMFNCAAQPGLAKVILTVLDFEGNAIRRRKAQNLRGGPKNAYGDCIGKTFEEVQKEYPIAIFIGLLPSNILDPEEMKRKGYGLCPDPKKVIQEDDLIIFIGPRSTPIREDGHQSIKNLYKQLAEKLELQRQQDKKLSPTRNSLDLKNVLVCGFRPVWLKNPERLRKRIMEIVVARAPGSFIIFLNGVLADEFMTTMSKLFIFFFPQNICISKMH